MTMLIKCSQEFYFCILLVFLCVPQNNRISLFHDKMEAFFIRVFFQFLSGMMMIIVVSPYEKDAVKTWNDK